MITQKKLNGITDVMNQQFKHLKSYNIMGYKKYKKQVEALKMAQKWFDSLPERVKSTLTRPGSIKQRTAH